MLLSTVNRVKSGYSVQLIQAVTPPGVLLKKYAIIFDFISILVLLFPQRVCVFLLWCLHAVAVQCERCVETFSPDRRTQPTPSPSRGCLFCTSRRRRRCPQSVNIKHAIEN